MAQASQVKTLLSIKRLRKLVALVYAQQPVKRSLHGVLYEIAGDHAAAAMLEQAICWQAVVNRKRAVDGWWWKDAREWHTEVGLTRRDVERGRRVLAAAGLEHDVKRLKDGRTMSHYRLRFDVLIGALAQALQTTVEALLGLLAGMVQTEQSGMYAADNPAMHGADNAERTPQTIPIVQSEQRGMYAADKESSVVKDLSSVEQTTEITTSAAAAVGESVDAIIEKNFAVKAENAETVGAPTAPPPVPASPLPELVTWRKVKALLELQLEYQAFQTWLKDAWLVRVEDGDAPAYVVGLPNVHAREYCETRLKRTIWKAFVQISGREEIDVRFELAVGSDPVEDAPPVLELLTQRGDVWRGDRLTPAQMYERYFNKPPDERLDRIAAAYPIDEVDKAIRATSTKRGVIDPVAYIGSMLQRGAVGSASASW